MRLAARLLDLDDLLEHGRVVARQERAAVDDHVDLVGAGLDRRADLGELDVAERLARREAGRDAGDLDGRARERVLRLGDERRVDADRGDGRDRRVARLGRIAFAHSARTLPGVSFPSRVVRSIIRIARSSAHSFEAFLIDRRLSDSTRSSTPTWSTRADPPEQAAERSPIARDRPSQARISSLRALAGEACRGAWWRSWDGEDTPRSAAARDGLDVRTVAAGRRADPGQVVQQGSTVRRRDGRVRLNARASLAACLAPRPGRAAFAPLVAGTVAAPAATTLIASRDFAFAPGRPVEIRVGDHRDLGEPTTASTTTATDGSRSTRVMHRPAANRDFDHLRRAGHVRVLSARSIRR